MTDEPVLDIDTIITRPVIDIDGKRHELLSPGELTVSESRRFALWQKRLNELQQREAEDAEDEAAIDAEIEALVDKMARKAAAPVPDDVFAALSGTHKTEIMEVFIGLLLRGKLRVVGAIGKATGNPSIGENLFPGFTASTAAAGGNGWMKRLSRWWART